MKKLTLAAVAAITCATAQAQSYSQANYQSTSGSDIFVAYSAGYLLDGEDVLHSVRIGLDKGCVSYYAQWAHFEIDETSGGFSIDHETNAFSLGVIGHHYFDSKINGYFGASVGIADTDNTVSALGLSNSESDTSLYFDLVAGLEYEFTERLSGNLGLRYLYVDDSKASLGGVSADTGSLDDVAIEAGITVSF